MFKKKSSKLKNIFLPQRTRHWHFFISPTTPDKIYKSIQEPQVNKSSGPISIPTKILKLAKDTLSGPLSELINKSVLSGIFL